MNSLVLHKILREILAGNIRDESRFEHWIAAQP